MIKFLYSIIITFLLYSTILAQESDTTTSRTELWYFYFGFGYSKMFYPSGVVQETVDGLKELEDVSHLPFSWDVFGIYVHITPKTIGGFIFTGSGDRYDRGERGGIQINQYTVGGSFIHYVGRTFGKGIFIRSHIGAANLAAGELELNEDGFSILAGGGWSVDFGGTRLLLNANYTYRLFKSGAYHTLTFSMGGLF